MKWILEELRRQRRGWAALRTIFGWQGVAAIAFVFGLLLGAVFFLHGSFLFTIAGIALLLAVRAHDLGDLEEGEPTEYGTFWDPSPAAQREREEAFLAEQLEDLQARAAQAEFISRRATADLGKPHDPVEL